MFLTETPCMIITELAERSVVFETSLSRYGAVAIISSAGGIPALLELFAALPAKLPFPVFVHQHFPRDCTSVLPELLGTRCALPIKWAVDRERPLPGTVYVARPADALRVVSGEIVVRPLETHWRAWHHSADALLSSLAEQYGQGAIAVMLSGLMAAGVGGLRNIRRAGGLVVVQSTTTARCIEMPSAARDLSKAEIWLSPTRIARLLADLASRSGSGPIYEASDLVPRASTA
jgi:chemotaxis response regulator CheB